MKDFLLLMYSDAVDQTAANNGEKWELYFSQLHASRSFDGGSSIGPGTKCRKNFRDQPSTLGANGFLRIRAQDITAAKEYLEGNPIYEAGGTVEILELPRDE